jgi:hypothetical protein
MAKKDWVDWQKIAINHAKKGKPVPKVENAMQIKIIDDFEVQGIDHKKAFNDFWLLQDKKAFDWWGAPKAPPPQPAAIEQFFEIPNPAKFLVEEAAPQAPQPAEPDPFNDNLYTVRKELQDIVDFSYANGEEPPLTLVRALNRIKLLEKNGDDWQAGYNVGWADAGGAKQQPEDDFDDPPDDIDL